MPSCEELVTSDAFIVSNLLKTQVREPKMMITIDDFSIFLGEVNRNCELAKTL